MKKAHQSIEMTLSVEGGREDDLRITSYNRRQESR